MKNRHQWTLMFVIVVSSLLMSRCSPYAGTKAMNYPKPYRFILVDSLNMRKNDLYTKLNEWMAKRYVSSKEVIQMQDKEAGKIVGKANIKIYNMAGSAYNYESVDYIITIDVKDGKYRCALSDFYHTGGVFESRTYTGFGSLNQSKVKVINLDEDEVMKIPPKWTYIKNSIMESSVATLNDLKTTIKSKEDDF